MIQDLGTIDRPLLLFGGPYGNLEATRALLAEAARLGIPPARTICTGDIVAYCADAQATSRLVMESGIHVVMGNCEESLGMAADACGCGFEDGSACDLMAARWYRHALETLAPAARAWMAARPRFIRFTMAGRRFLVVHGAASAINRFVFPATSAAEKQAELALAGVDAIVAGHSGLPFTQNIGRRLWHNPGAIGLPANDGTPRVWYSVLAPSADGIEIGHRPLGYDHLTAARKIRAAGLPAAYAEALESGLWPSDEIMPLADRARRGQALAFRDQLWPTGLRAAAA
ncbi:MAG: metallophosphoesterase family protein [Pseudomonadota bacterium]